MPSVEPCDNRVGLTEGEVVSKQIARGRYNLTARDLAQHLRQLPGDGSIVQRNKRDKGKKKRRDLHSVAAPFASLDGRASSRQQVHEQQNDGHGK